MLRWATSRPRVHGHLRSGGREGNVITQPHPATVMIRADAPQGSARHSSTDAAREVTRGTGPPALLRFQCDKALTDLNGAPTRRRLAVQKGHHSL